MPILNTASPVGNVYQSGDSAGREPAAQQQMGSVYQSGQYGSQLFEGDTGFDEDMLNHLSRYIQDLQRAFEGSSTRSKIMTLIQDSRRAYYTEVEDTDWPWEQASNMITPLTTMGVDEVEPRLAAAVIGREPYIKVDPTKATGQDPNQARLEARAIEKFDEFILEHKLKVKELVPKMIHEMLLDGTVYALLSWEDEQRHVRRNILQQDPQTGQPSYQKQDTMERRYGPKVSLVPPDFVWHADDLDHDDWEKQPVIRYVGEYTVGELMRRAQTEPGWMLPEDINRYQTSTKYYKTVQQEAEEVVDYGWIYAPHQRPIEFYEAYLEYPIYGEERGDVSIVVLVELNSFHVFRIREQIDLNDENIRPLRRIRFVISGRII